METVVSLEPRYAVAVRRNVRIPMPDGVTLAADLWMPDGAGPFPVVIEYLPYRKNDQPQARYTGHHYFAERGFVAARVDIRGTGDSWGISTDEYSAQEQRDALAMIAWFAEQPWSNGNVGMFGESYGGFNSVQIAMLRPPALKAISPMYFTDRRYTDDCHYKGGSLQMLYDTATYGLSMAGRNLLPPRPDLVGDGWMDMWRQRLEGNEPWLLRWIEHQTEDEQWLHGSLCTDYTSIEAASFLIGGWRDGYMNCNLRSFEHLRCPRKLLIGPWLHLRPDHGVPGPAINHWRERARFFAHWLGGLDTGVMDEPPITLYIQSYDPPRPNRVHTSGHWRHETEWPLTRAQNLTLHLLPAGHLEPQNPKESPLPASLTYDPTVGATFGWYSGGPPLTLAADQRVEEARSLVYTTPPLAQPLEILGYPTAILHLECDVDVITYSVRLCDVAPDGRSALVTKGVLNATRRESMRAPTPLEPGRVYELTIELDATAWRFETGHRVRLSVANADFPNTWPTPKPATTRLHHGRSTPSRLVLPTVPPDPRSLPTPDLEPMPEAMPESDRGDFRIVRDLMRGTTAVLMERGPTTTRADVGVIHETSSSAAATVDEADPARASVRGEQRARWQWPNRLVEMRSHGLIESDASRFYVSIAVAIDISGQPFFNRRWDRTFPRHLM